MTLLSNDSTDRYLPGYTYQSLFEAKEEEMVLEEVSMEIDEDMVNEITVYKCNLHLFDDVEEEAVNMNPVLHSPL